MRTITILSAHEIQKIAAGEVVHRPANVVKELLENSLDAHSTHVTLYIEKAGKKLIRVVDNGEGMSREDAAFCFHPHATSKITTVDDLTHIDTFGFRGEALASIASISHVTLITRHRTAPVGVQVEFTKENEPQITETAGNSGCDIAIADLFYNTPARRKFLKQDETEWSHILSVFHAFCLTNPTVHFTLYRDGTQTLNLPAVDKLHARLEQLWGHDFAKHMIDVQSKNETISGMISHHQFWRYNRSHIFFFVNNRHVKNYALSKALMNGYKNVLPAQRYPAACIFLTVNGNDVDINVHPRKEEVQFSRPGIIERIIKETVSQTLEAHISHQFTRTPSTGEVATHHLTDSPFSPAYPDSFHAHQNASGTTADARSLTTLPSSTHRSPSPPVYVHTTFKKSQPPSPQEPTPASPPAASPAPETQSTLHKFSGTIIGQLCATYVLIEHDNKLLIVDQHAAHERILYEQCATHFHESIGTKLLFPELVTLSEATLDRLMRYQSICSTLGLEIDRASTTTLAIKSAPPNIHRQSLTELVREMSDFIEEHSKLDHDILTTRLTEHARGQMACKAAIKAGDVLSHQEMRQLIITLLDTPNRFICVHGRPTMWTISQHELEKKFQRQV